MKLYTLQSNTNTAQKRDYLYEMDKKIESLINYIDLTNPNWQIINKKYTDNSNSTLVSMVDLLKYGIIKLVWFDNKLNTCFSVNKLKLHKGLVNEYGPNTYYWLLDDDSFDGIKYTVNFATISDNNQITDAQKNSLKQWQTNFLNSSSNFNFDFYIINFNSNTYVRLSDGTNSISNINLWNDFSIKSFSITNNQIDLHTHKPATANSFLIKAQEGTVIFCNYLNENVATSSSDKNRNMISSYKIFSITSATDLFLPTQYWTDNGKVQWQWKYIESATDNSGTNYIFHLPCPPQRVYLHTGPDKYSIKKLNINSTTNTHTEVSMIINNGQIVPNIASKNSIVWNVYDNNNILSKIYHLQKTSDSTNDFTLEEVFVDKEITTNTLNIENYQTSNYTITVKDNDIYKSLNLYLNIM